MTQSIPKLFKARGRIATDILGRSKYTTYQEALNEAVANSMDWFANKIWIRLEKNFIEIEDNGVGMSEKVLIDRYFGLGAENLDPKKKGQFGIGICANAALGNILILETHQSGEKYGLRAKINFMKLEQVYLGEYEPESWDNHILFPTNHHGTKVRIEFLRWRNIDEDGIISYIKEKHWPALIDPEIEISIYVNGQLVKIEEPNYDHKFEFDSFKRFQLDKKFVPPMPNLKCGRVRGVFYIIENCEHPSIDVYVKNQRLDAYSGDRVDWLSIKDLRSPKGFQSEVKGIIKVEAQTKTPEEERDPLVHIKNEGLIIKSDRSRFFENTWSFEHLCAYLNEKSNGPVLKLPNGGILRLINNKWYSDKATNFQKNISIVEKQIEELKPEIIKVLKGAEAYRRVSSEGEEKEKSRKLIKNTSIEETQVPQNVMLQCTQCGKINRIPRLEIEKWHKSGYKEKLILQEKWKCLSCGKMLHPVNDKYKKESPIATSGKILTKVDLGIGQLKTIKADILGERGPRSVYNLEEEVIRINVQHSLLVYSLKISPEALKTNLIDSTVFAVALEIANERGEEFQTVYNNLSVNIGRLLDPSAYDEALEKFI